MSIRLQIDFVSDVACPWCAIGLASLERALERTAAEVGADIHLQPFELNPQMRGDGENLDALLSSRYGAGADRLLAMRENVRSRAAEVGFTIRQDGSSRIYNTFDAHRLLFWARESGRQLALKHALFEANFTDGANVSDHEVLVRAASAAGLDAAEARAVLASNRHADDVREAEQAWTSRGIRGVPAIVINGKWLISGGQPAGVFEEALRKMAGDDR